MNKDIPLKLVVTSISNEKGVAEEVIFEAIEMALVSATKKKYGQDKEFNVKVDRKTGSYETFRSWTVVEELVEATEDDDDEKIQIPSINSQILLADAREKKPDAVIGETIEELVESIDFGRISAQAAKQVIIQKVKEAEKKLVAVEFQEKIGHIVSGVVKKTTRDSIIVDLGGNAEGLLKREEMLPRESVRVGDRVRACLKEITEDTRNPQLMLSRITNDMLIELFKIEVPEVGEGIIEVKSSARDPGNRAKIAVKTNDGRIDAVGACVGMRGARVQAVSNELGGERVDIVLWEAEPVQFVINAMAPSEVVSIVIDEEQQTMDVAIKDEFLSQAIGRNGQNVRLASDLTGWKLTVISDSEAKEKSTSEQSKLESLFQENLNIEKEVAELLLEAGFTSIEEIAFVPVQELMAIEGFDEEIIEDLRNRAKEILAEELASKKAVTDQLEKELLNMDGVDYEIAKLLVDNSLLTRDDLAEQSIEDLVEMMKLSEKKAGNLIMAARAHWFADEEK